MKDKWIGKWAFPSDDSLLEQSARRGEQYDFDSIAQDIIDKLKFDKTDVVLDMCCGNAAIAKRISKQCGEIHGVDFSEVLISSAKHVQKNENIANLCLYVADALSIDKLFKENYFDKTYCYFSFQYFDKFKRELLLEKLSRVTKPNGSIFIGDVPDKTRKWNFYESKMKFYREKISRLIQFKEGECDMGWWVDSKEILDWCKEHKLNAEIISQNKNMPHVHYRFDALIRNSK